MLRTALAAHLDGCRDSRVSALAAQLGITDEAVIGLFRHATHDGDRHALAVDDGHEASRAILDAALGDGRLSSLEPVAAVAAASPAAAHCMVLLPSGPSYMLGGHDAHEIVPGLFLGSEAAARSASFLRANNIRGIVNCAIDSEPMEEAARASAGIISFKHVKIVDTPGVGNRKGLDEGLAAAAACVREVAACGDGGAVLIHCIAGVSRSATVTIAFLMQERGMRLLNAAALVKSTRKVVYPNAGFFRCLIEFAAERADTSLSLEALQLHKALPMTAVRVRAREDGVPGFPGLS